MKLQIQFFAFFRVSQNKIETSKFGLILKSPKQNKNLVFALFRVFQNKIKFKI